MNPLSYSLAHRCHARCRLQAVPFWIVKRSRKIAERGKKTRANERRGALGEAGKRGKDNFFFFNNNNLFYKFGLHKGLAPQIATKLVEAGQDEHENIMEKNYSKLSYKHAGKQKKKT